MTYFENIDLNLNQLKTSFRVIYNKSICDDQIMEMSRSRLDRYDLYESCETPKFLY